MASFADTLISLSSARPNQQFRQPSVSVEDKGAMEFFTTELLDSSPGPEFMVARKPVPHRRRHVAKGLGLPEEKPYLTASDFLNIVVTLICFSVAVAAVQSVHFAAYLGQVYQLVLLGLTLAIMAAITSNQVQLLLITLEARFGSSTVQNYDAILRNNKFSKHTSLQWRLALIATYLLPLGIGASYKLFVGGETTVSAPNDRPITFGPSGPPGLYLQSAIGGFVSAMSPLYSDHPQARSQPPHFPSSYGFNMHIINSTVSAMLDTPLPSDLAAIKASLKPGEVQRLSAAVNATFSSLNSTKNSTERGTVGDDTYNSYWSNIYDRYGDDIFDQPWGGGTWFGMWSGGPDQSLVFLSFFNATLYQSFQSEANGFNLYRGSCTGTWLITSSGIFLEDASDFETSWFPEAPHPVWLGNGTCDEPPGADPSQTIITCFWNPVAFDFYSAVSEYLVPSIPVWNGTDQLSIWVAAVAAVLWSTLAANLVPTGPTWASPVAAVDFVARYPNVMYTSPYNASLTLVTMRRHWGLFALLSIHPLLLAALLSARILLYSTPVSENFGVTALLAGASKSSLEVLEGAAFSGRLARPVKVQILRQEAEMLNGESISSIQYVFDGTGSNSRLPRRRHPGRGDSGQGGNYNYLA